MKRLLNIKLKLNNTVFYNIQYNNLKCLQIKSDRQIYLEIETEVYSQEEPSSSEIVLRKCMTGHCSLRTT